MKSIRTLLVLLISVSAFAQSAPQKPAAQLPPQPAQQTPPSAMPPETKAPPTPADKKGTQQPTTPATSKSPDRAAAYYHYSLAHIYEELVALYGRAEFANQAVSEYRQAIQADPGSAFLNAGLAELYAKTGRIRDAVLEAQEILKRDPSNLDARKLLGRIYLRSLGDMQTGTQSQEMLRLAIDQFEQIVKLEPKSVDDRLLLGRLYITNKDLLKAEAIFKSALQIDPNSEEAVTNLAYLYNEEGDANKAAQVIASVPESSRSAKLFAALGFTYEQQHESKKAIEAYRKAVELDKDNLDALRGLAQNLLNDGQLEQSLEQYKAIAEADSQDAQAQLRIAEIQRRLGRYDAALQSLKTAESLVQESLEVPYNYALVYSAQGRYDEAVAILQKLLDKTTKPTGDYTQAENNNRSVFLERLGIIYKDSGKTQLAIDTFRKLLPLGEENATRGYAQIIDTYRDAKMWPQATAAAQEAAAKYPKDIALRLTLAGQLADNGKIEEGVAQAKSLLGGKDDREVYLGMAQIYSRLRRWPEAEQSAAQAEKISTKPEEKEYAYFVQASLLERQKRYDDAERMFRKVLQLDPQNAMTLNYLGYMLADRGVRLDEALNYIKKALELDPQNGAYMDSLGWAYFRLGKYDLAEENLRKAISKSANDPTLHDHLGDLYQKTGRLKLAASHWERALEEWNRSVPADVDNSDVAKVQKKLEGARVRLAKESDGKINNNR
jgi:tetratricopeptide (TPR) repeat protein